MGLDVFGHCKIHGKFYISLESKQNLALLKRRSRVSEREIAYDCTNRRLRSLERAGRTGNIMVVDKWVNNVVQCMVLNDAQFIN